MIKKSLFAAEEREAKLDQLGDVLQLLERHVDFAVLAREVIFEAVGGELSRHGYLARCGQIVDASLIPAPAQHNPTRRTGTGPGQRHAHRLEAHQAQAKGRGRHLDEKARQVHFRLQALRQRRPALQVDLQGQGQHGFGERYDAS